MMRRTLVATGLVMLILACSQRRETADVLAPEGASQSVPSGGRRYSEVVGTSAASRVPFDLCHTVRHPMWEGAGLYTVESLTGRTEDDLRNRPDVAGFTYVDLRLVHEWFNAPKHPIARIIGGPFPGGEEGGWNVSLKVGETVGLFLITPNPLNRDYYDVDELGVFHADENGGYTNGLIFTKKPVSADELGALVAGLAGPKLDASCPYNEFPDFEGHPTAATAQTPAPGAKEDATTDAGSVIAPAQGNP